MQHDCQYRHFSEKSGTVLKNKGQREISLSNISLNLAANKIN
jgi:hypothetical protein